jgi:hypothetical protein
MLLVAALAPFVVLATSVAANPKATRNPHISLSITKHVNGNGTSSLPLRDQKRSMNLVKDCRQSEITDVPLNDSAIAYSVNIDVGDPPTNCEFCQFMSGIVSYMII